MSLRAITQSMLVCPATNPDDLFRRQMYYILSFVCNEFIEGSNTTTSPYYWAFFKNKTIPREMMPKASHGLR
jgi:hypothetical protein